MTALCATLGRAGATGLRAGHDSRRNEGSKNSRNKIHNDVHNSSDCNSQTNDSKNNGINIT